jgi:dolichyl-phosphate beta-glucosyltransferase
VSPASAVPCLVVPCYNEAARLDEDALAALVAGEIPCARLLMVDDGSRDETGVRLARLCQRAPPGRIELLALPRNRGKAEAVRQGLLRALADGAPVVGYFDADLSTPVPEIRRLLEVLADGDAQAVIGARVSLLGSDIRRSMVRHYLGRVFATAASLLLQTQIYDTQCGAKLFRRSPALAAALDEPFLSRWSFDVELLGRLLVGTATVAPVDQQKVVEVPLRAWRDVPGSKLRFGAMAGALVELSRIGLDLERRRRSARAGRPTV